MKRIIFIPAISKENAIAKGERFEKEIINIDGRPVELDIYEEIIYYDAILVDDEIHLKKGELGYNEDIGSILESEYCDDCKVKILAISNNDIYNELPILTKEEIFKYTLNNEYKQTT